MGRALLCGPGPQFGRLCEEHQKCLGVIVRPRLWQGELRSSGGRLAGRAHFRKQLLDRGVALLLPLQQCEEPLLLLLLLPESRQLLVLELAGGCKRLDQFIEQGGLHGACNSLYPGLQHHCEGP